MAKMKDEEKMTLLANANYGKKLFKANQVFKKIKGAAVAVAAYKKADDEKLTELIGKLGKIRVGAVVTRYAKLMARRAEITLEGKDVKNFDRELSNIEKEMNAIWSMQETLNSQTIDVLKSMYSRKSEATIAEIYADLEVTADNVIERSTKSPKKAEVKKGIETIFAKAEAILKDAEKRMAEQEAEQAEEKTEDKTEQAENKATEGPDGVIYVDLSGTDEDEEEGGTEAVREDNGRDTDETSRLAS